MNLKTKLLDSLKLKDLTLEIDNLIDSCINLCFGNYEVISYEKKVQINKELKKVLNLKGCKDAYFNILSLGNKAQALLDKEKDEFTKYIIDEVFNLILDQEYENKWCELKSKIPSNLGLTHPYSPGANCPLELQKIIFDEIKPHNLFLDDSYFITPTKTITFIIGVGNIKTPSSFNKCDYCNYPKCKVRITIDHKEYFVNKGERLIDVFLKYHLPINSFCGGNKRCGKCYVFVDDKKMLACETIVSNNMHVTTLPSLEKMAIETNAIDAIQDINKKHETGIVIDVGTTTIVGVLYDLITGFKADTIAFHNKQYQHGLDVISRITYTLTNLNGLDILNNLIIEQLNDCIKKLESNHLKKIIIVGNPTMISIILKLPLASLATYPYSTSLTQFITVNGKDLNLNKDVPVTFIYAASSFIGSDIVSGIIACNFLNSDKYQLLIDLGTNGEISLGNKDEVYCCSVASGPAFEGANISCGVPSIPGAIYEVNFHDNSYKTINNVSPIGFCGLGIIDLVSNLLIHQYIDESGLYIKDPYKLETNNQEFILTQQDIREVQLAKSAIITGIELLLSKLNINYQDIENVYLSGGFGSNINIDSCINIGLIPQALRNKIKIIGNSALKGAALYLIDPQYEEDFIKLKSIINNLDLIDNPSFQDKFIDNLKLQPK